MNVPHQTSCLFLTSCAHHSFHLCLISCHDQTSCPSLTSFEKVKIHQMSQSCYHLKRYEIDGQVGQMNLILISKYVTLGPTANEKLATHSE